MSEQSIYSNIFVINGYGLKYIEVLSQSSLNSVLNIMLQKKKEFMFKCQRTFIPVIIILENICCIIFNKTRYLYKLILWNVVLVI